MSEIVTVQRLDRYALCTLNLPRKRNPISPAMRTALVQALETLKRDDEVRAVVITGAGSAFCSGLDLDELSLELNKPAEQHHADSQSIADFFDYIVHYAKPTIAAVNGPAVAGGCGLAVLCDITVMSDAAFLSFSEVKIGFVPALVGVYLERMIGQKAAREALLTGRKIPAAEALTRGFVTEVAPANEVLKRAGELAQVLAMNSPAAVAATKALLVQAATVDLDRALADAVSINALARSSSDCKEGVQAFLEKRLPAWNQPPTPTAQDD